jgi:hypothetical protein
MKLSLSISIAIALLANDSEVAAFTPSKNAHSISFTHAGVPSFKPMSMAAEAETETDILLEDGTALDFEGVNKLPYRSLQKECKNRGLAANGNTAILRRSLLQAMGLFTPKDDDCVIIEGGEVS